MNELNRIVNGFDIHCNRLDMLWVPVGCALCTAMCVLCAVCAAESAALSASGSAEGDNKAVVREQLSKLNQEADELAAELKEARQAYKGDLQNNKLERLYDDAQRRYDQLSERRKALEAQLTGVCMALRMQPSAAPVPHPRAASSASQHRALAGLVTP